VTRPTEMRLNGLLMRARSTAALSALALLTFTPSALSYSANRPISKPLNIQRPRAAHLDASFGEDGRVILSPDLKGEPIAPVAVLARDDGLILGAGQSLRRLAPDGQLDESFGEGGTLTPPAPPDGEFTIDGLAVDSQGRLIVAGTSTLPTENVPSSFQIGNGTPEKPTMVRVMRYLPSGSLDPSFGDHGVLETDLGLPAPRNEAGEQLLAKPLVEVTGLALDAEDRVILTGGASAGVMFACFHDWYFNTLTYAAFVARFDVYGALDASFGGGDGVFGGRSVEENALHAEVGASPLVATDGEVTYVRGDAHCRSGGFAGLARLSADGMPSASFGREGAVRRWSTAAVMGLDGSITALSYVSPWYFVKEPMRVVVSRLRPNGKLDRSYGRNGHAVARSPGGPRSTLGTPAIDGQGRVLLAGTMISARTTPAHYGSGRKRHRHSFVLVRLGLQGRLDRTFGPRGRLAVSFGSLGVAESSLLLDSQGRAVLVGTYGRPDKARGIVLARYVVDR
jgi:uncharacterized delta-60 repeat protein